MNKNYHYTTYNNLKIKFKEIIAHNLENTLFKGKIGIEYVIYYRDKRITDRMNVLSFVDKFFCDSLTELGCIEDDNDSVVQYQLFRTGGIDKLNPRCEITVHDLSIN